MFFVISSNNGILIVTMVACQRLTNTLQLPLPVLNTLQLLVNTYNKPFHTLVIPLTF